MVLTQKKDRPFQWQFTTINPTITGSEETTCLQNKRQEFICSLRSYNNTLCLIPLIQTPKERQARPKVRPNEIGLSKCALDMPWRLCRVLASHRMMGREDCASVTGKINHITQRNIELDGSFSIKAGKGIGGRACCVFVHHCWQRKQSKLNRGEERLRREWRVDAV